MRQQNAATIGVSGKHGLSPAKRFIWNVAESWVSDAVFRKDAINQLCVGKSVLHLGFIQHAHLYEERLRTGEWLHAQIGDVARRLVGIDYLDDEVTRIRSELGYEVYTGDVCRLADVDLDEAFDVIVCGELIEHVENPGLMLEGIKRFCHSQTLVVLTTPNPWSRQRMKLLRHGDPEESWLNPEHTMWFSFQTLKQLLARAGYKCTVGDYYFNESREVFLGRATGELAVLRLLKRVLSVRLTPRSQYDGLYFVATPPPTAPGSKEPATD